MKQTAIIVDASLIKRFTKKFDRPEEGCWEWTASTSSTGYGQINLTGNSGMVSAHRVAFTLENGPIPEGMSVCHTCDNPKCVRPDHLFLGTPKDNNHDCRLKYRHPAVGSLNHKARLIEDEVREIRGKYATGKYTQKELGRDYGVCYTTIGMIVRGERWKCVA